MACTDWRPGEEPISISTTTQALENANYDFNQPHPVSLNELEPYNDPTLSRHLQDHLRAYNDEFRPLTTQELTASAVWPKVPAKDRHLRLPYPHDHLFRNERGLIESSSKSGGLSQIAYFASINSSRSSANLPSWPNQANEKPAVTSPSTLYDQIEAQVGWKIVRSFPHP